MTALKWITLRHCVRRANTLTAMGATVVCLLAFEGSVYGQEPASDAHFDLCLVQNYGRVMAPERIVLDRSNELGTITLTFTGSNRRPGKYEYMILKGLPESLSDGTKIFASHEPPSLENYQLFLLEYPDGRIEARVERFEAKYTNENCKK